MSTKVEMQTKINTITTGGNNPATTVRGVLGIDPGSLLESIYPTVLTDSNATSTYLTWSGSTSWSASIVKIGRSVTMDIDLTASATMQLNAATIIAGDLTPDANAPYHTTGSIVGGDFIGVNVSGAGITFPDALLIGERISFSITYNTLA